MITVRRFWTCNYSSSQFVQVVCFRSRRRWSPRPLDPRQPTTVCALLENHYRSCEPVTCAKWGSHLGKCKCTATHDHVEKVSMQAHFWIIINGDIMECTLLTLSLIVYILVLYCVLCDRSAETCRDTKQTIFYLRTIFANLNKIHITNVSRHVPFNVKDTNER